MRGLSPLCLFISLCVVFGHPHHEEENIVYPSPRSASSLQLFALNQVSLLPGTPSYDGQQVNAQYLHLLDNDRLLYNFMVTAGINSTAEPLGGWEAPDCQLRGHFVGMYLSASAKAYNTYGDTTQLAKAQYIIENMYKCQQKIGTGYLSAFPSSLFDTLESLQWVWAPYYTMHKIMQGLWDMHTLTGNAQAGNITVAMADYFFGRMQNVVNTYGMDRWEQILNIEFGGMNDIMYQIYAETKNTNHSWMAQMFDLPSFLQPIQAGQDDLTGIHANFHIPIVIGSAQRYEVIGDPNGQTIADNFYGFVVNNRTYATGGHNGGNGSDSASNEYWGLPGKLAATLTNNNQEFCTTYNTLKLTTHLIQWYGEPEHMDFYERAYFNGILGSSNLAAGPGVMLYNYPMATGYSKETSFHGWGDQNNTFWCCYATGVDQWAKMGEAIYFKSTDDTQVFVSLFVASTLNWQTQNVKIIQQTTFPVAHSTGLTISAAATTSFTLNIRIPYWANPANSSISVNGAPVNSPIVPSSLFSIKRAWENNDIVNISLPFSLHLSPIIDQANLVAIMYGPLVLGGLTKVEHTLPISSASQLPSIMKPVSGSPNTFIASVDGGSVQMQMQPLYTIDNDTYGVYWTMDG